MDDDDPLSYTLTKPDKKKPVNGPLKLVPSRVFSFSMAQLQRAVKSFASYDELEDWVIKKAKEC